MGGSLPVKVGTYNVETDLPGGADGVRVDANIDFNSDALGLSADGEVTFGVADTREHGMIGAVRAEGSYTRGEETTQVDEFDATSDAAERTDGRAGFTMTVEIQGKDVQIDCKGNYYDPVVGESRDILFQEPTYIP